MSLSRFLSHKALHITILLILVWCCYSRTLGSYFIADDFPEIKYVSNIFHGHPELILSNFTGNFMQVPGMQVYRPGFLITIILDFLCYGNKAWGYFLSNILYFTTDVITFYLLCRALTERWPRKNSILFALSTAALFAVSPLHCEAISWMVGRGDPDSASFYLISLLLFVKYLTRPRPQMMLFTLITFATALSIKEMPVGLPAVATVIAFFWNDASAFRSRILKAGRCTLPLWITLAVYFLIRYLSLGTLAGGYVGSVGASFSAMLTHWTDKDTIVRLFLPVTDEVSKQSLFTLPALRALYTIVASLACIRFFSGCWSLRFLFLIAAMMLTTALPIFQLWGLGPNLEGGRFYFYLSMSMSMLIPLLLFHPAETVAEKKAEIPDEQLDEQINEPPKEPQEPPEESKEPPNEHSKSQTESLNPGRFGVPLTVLSIATTVLMIITLCRTTTKTNLLWVHAGKEDLHLSQACQKLAAEINQQKHILLLGVPEDYHGAHLILNRTMFDLMLQPPFVSEDLSSRFYTTVPLVYGAGEYVNGSRLQELLTSPDVIGPYVWVRDQQKFERIGFATAQNQKSNLENLNARLATSGSSYESRDHIGAANYSVFLNNLELNPTDADCIEFKVRATEMDNEPIKIVWNGEKPNSETPTDAPGGTAKLDIDKTNALQTIRIRLGHYWRWYSCGRIRSIEIILPKSKTILIKDIRLLPYDLSSPLLTLQTAASDRYVTPVSTTPVDLHLSCEKIKGVASLQLEVGKNNYFFDNYQKATDVDPVAFKISLPANTVVYKLTDQYFPRPGHYQVRLRCLDQRGKAIGENSDALTLIR